jgi:hypothetical protein
MKPKTKQSPECVVREIKRKTRRRFNSEEKIRIILEGLRGEEGMARSMYYYKWSKAFLGAGHEHHLVVSLPLRKALQAKIARKAVSLPPSDRARVKVFVQKEF